jgi:hypothetical protein
VGALVVALLAVFGSPPGVRPNRPPKNLRVISVESRSDLDAGMKALTKGLGVKCTACHVDDEPERDDKTAKLEARSFLVAVVGSSNRSEKDAALAELVKKLGLQKARDPEAIWAGIAKWKKKE